MPRCLLMVVILMFAALPLSAEDEKGHFAFNKDRFLVGTTVVQDVEGVDDLFMAGETVRSRQDISGTVHLAGRKVTSAGAVGGDAYLAGMDVSVEGKVIGDVTASGYSVTVGEVGGDLRVSAANLTISGPIAGYALITADEVTFSAPVKGDVHLTAREVEFLGGTRIEGTLTIYEEQPGDVTVPEDVVPEERIQRRDVSEWSEAAADVSFWNWPSAFGGFLRGVLIITAIAILVAALVPHKLADLRRSILAQPFRNLFFGFLVLSVVIGSTVILMLTGIGLLLAPATLILALVGAFAGYVVGAYAVGVGLLLAVSRSEPEDIRARALAAGLGAFVVALIGLIPFLGWLFVMAVALVGAGSITIRLFRPKFFAST